MQDLTREDIHDYYEPKKVLRDAFVVMGEAAKNVSQDCKEEWPEIPWVELKKLRNVVAHHYDGVDYNVVFDTIRNELPRLKEKLDYLKLPQIKVPRLIPAKKKSDLLNKPRAKAKGLVPKSKRKGLL